MAVTIADIRDRTVTDLDDDTLTRILNAAVEDLVRRVGPADAEVETVNLCGRRVISVMRPIVAVTSVVERRTMDSDPVTLAVNDWRLIGRYELYRLNSGTNSALTWGHEVVVTYEPAVDVTLRDRVVLDVCQMDIEFRALRSERSGDWSGDYSDYRERRNALFEQVQEGRSLVS